LFAQRYRRAPTASEPRPREKPWWRVRWSASRSGAPTRGDGVPAARP